MKTLDKIKMVSLLFSMTIISFTNCSSVMGLGIGAIVDSNNKEVLNFSRFNVTQLKNNQKITVILKNGSLIMGRFESLGKSSANSVVQQYSSFKLINQELLPFPKVGENVKLITNTGETVELRFIGFDIITFDNGRVGFKIPHPAINSFINLENVRSMKLESDEVITKNTLERLLISGEIPVLTTINVKTSYGLNEIPLHDINIIQYNKKKNGKTKGFLIGLAIDLFYAYTISRNYNNDYSGDGYYQNR